MWISKEMLGSPFIAKLDWTTIKGIQPRSRMQHASFVYICVFAREKESQRGPRLQTPKSSPMESCALFSYSNHGTDRISDYNIGKKRDPRDFPVIESSWHCLFVSRCKHASTLQNILEAASLVTWWDESKRERIKILFLKMRVLSCRARRKSDIIAKNVS